MQLVEQIEVSVAAHHVRQFLTVRSALYGKALLEHRKESIPSSSVSTSASRTSPRAAPTHLRSFRTCSSQTGSRMSPNALKFERSLRVATRAW